MRFAIGVVASAAVGALVALYLSSEARPARRGPPPLDVGALQAALERAFESVGFGAQARSPQFVPAMSGPPGRPADEPGRPTAPATAKEGRDGAEELPVKNGAAVDSVRPFAADERLRRTWLFRSERDVIAWLGSPDEVYYEAGGERWLYTRADGSVLAAYFARGRLLNIVG